MVLQEKAGIKEKLAILADAAKYDVACTSSGVSRKGKKGMLGSCEAAGVCHSFFCGWKMHFSFKDIVYK